MSFLQEVAHSARKESVLGDGVWRRAFKLSNLLTRDGQLMPMRYLGRRTPVHPRILGAILQVASGEAFSIDGTSDRSSSPSLHAQL